MILYFYWFFVIWGPPETPKWGAPFPFFSFLGRPGEIWGRPQKKKNATGALILVSREVPKWQKTSIHLLCFILGQAECAKRLNKHKTRHRRNILDGTCTFLCELRMIPSTKCGVILFRTHVCVDTTARPSMSPAAAPLREAWKPSVRPSIRDKRETRQ